MKKEISIFEIVGNPLCISSSDGQKVYDHISSAIRKNKKIILSFNNISIATPTFLNSAIGQLYGEFNENQIKSSLILKDIKPDDIAVLKQVIENAKNYFNKKKRRLKFWPSLTYERSEIMEKRLFYLSFYIDDITFRFY